jgi:hypothetical protein
MSILKKITNLKKLPLDANLSKEVFVDTLQSLVEWGNSASPVFTMVNVFQKFCFTYLFYVVF